MQTPTPPLGRTGTQPCRSLSEAINWRSDPNKGGVDGDAIASAIFSADLQIEGAAQALNQVDEGSGVIHRPSHNKKIKIPRSAVGYLGTRLSRGDSLSVSVALANQIKSDFNWGRELDSLLHGSSKS